MSLYVLGFSCYTRTFFRERQWVWLLLLLGWGAPALVTIPYIVYRFQYEVTRVTIFNLT